MILFEVTPNNNFEEEKGNFEIATIFFGYRNLCIFISTRIDNKLIGFESNNGTRVLYFFPQNMMGVTQFLQYILTKNHS